MYYLKKYLSVFLLHKILYFLYFLPFLKKFYFLTLALICAFVANADTFTAGTKFYLNPSIQWSEANARFALHVAADNTGATVAWVDMTDEDGDGVDDKTGKSVQKVYIEPGDYERGSTGINPNKGYCPNFVEPNNTVKSSFDATTMSIIEKHLEDFDYSTYKPSEGGKYIKSLGGIFSKYYGQEVHVTTAGELQEVAEYVFGLMYIYGFDYYNGSKYCKWGGSCDSPGSGADDAFYPQNELFYPQYLGNTVDQRPQFHLHKAVNGQYFRVSLAWFHRLCRICGKQPYFQGLAWLKN